MRGVFPQKPAFADVTEPLLGILSPGSDDAANGHDIRWTWTKGHAGHGDNNRVDELATLAARERS